MGSGGSPPSDSRGCASPPGGCEAGGAREASRRRRSPRRARCCGAAPVPSRPAPPNGAAPAPGPPRPGPTGAARGPMEGLRALWLLAAALGAAGGHPHPCRGPTRPGAAVRLGALLPSGSPGPVRAALSGGGSGGGPGAVLPYNRSLEVVAGGPAARDPASLLRWLCGALLGRGVAAVLAVPRSRRELLQIDFFAAALRVPFVSVVGSGRAPPFRAQVSARPGGTRRGSAPSRPRTPSPLSSRPGSSPPSPRPPSRLHPTPHPSPNLCPYPGSHLVSVPALTWPPSWRSQSGLLSLILDPIPPSSWLRPSPYHSFVPTQPHFPVQDSLGCVMSALSRATIQLQPCAPGGGFVPLPSLSCPPSGVRPRPRGAVIPFILSGAFELLHLL